MFLASYSSIVSLQCIYKYLLCVLFKYSIIISKL